MLQLLLKTLPEILQILRAQFRLFLQLCLGQAHRFLFSCKLVDTGYLLLCQAFSLLL